MRINKHDTNGTKPLLGKGELGYDDYVAGGDVGRVYVGTGTENIALAEKLEANLMTKAQFNALAEERKANRAGSGFDERGKHLNNGTSIVNVNEGIFTVNNAANANTFYLGDSVGIGVSKTVNPIMNINGTRQSIAYINNAGNSSNKIILPTAPNIYPYDTVLTAEQIANGVIKHADASNSGLIVNGKFDSGTSGWTALDSSLVVESNKLKITNTTASNGTARQTFPSIVGKEYIVEFEATSGSHNLGMQIKGDAYGITGWSVADATTGRYTFKYTATTTTTYLLFAVYNNSLGAYAYVDNIAVYPADAISRSDLVFLESFHEDISEKNFVYPLGNVQYLGGNTDGLTGITNGNFTGFETYSLFGNFQAPSALIGKGYVWSNLTEAQKRAFIANPENNCYLDVDKTIQVRYRVRVVMGWGDSWHNIDPYVNMLLYSVTGAVTYVNAQGKNVSPSGVSNTTYARYFSPITNQALLLTNEKGIFVSEAQSGVSYTNYAIALPIALVPRKNQGIYHNLYNPNGSKKASDGNFWYNTAVSFTSISDCFDPSKLLTASGYIGTVSGRPDGLFYDQVHESDIIDLRNSSKKVEDYNRLIRGEFNKLVAGTTRGKEGEWRYELTFKDTIASIGVGFFNVTTNTIGLFGNGYLNKLPVLNRIIVENVTRGLTVPIEYYGTYNRLSIPSFSSLSTWTAGDIVNIYIAGQTTRTKSNTLTHCDIIGNLTNYPTAWKQSGVSGTPLIVAEDGTSLLPDGVRDTFKLSRKANATPLLCLRSTDNGATWTSFTPTFSTTTNEITLTNEPANNLVMIYYQTKTSMAVPSVNSEIVEAGEVLGTNGLANGALISTLIGKVPTANTAPYLQMGYDINGYRIDMSTLKFSTTATEIPLHSALSLAGGAVGVPAVKVFPYLTRANGKAFLNLVFKEMKHNGTSWGDSNKFEIVDNVSTTTDNNAQTVLVGQKTVELPYFIGADE